MTTIVRTKLANIISEFYIKENHNKMERTSVKPVLPDRVVFKKKKEKGRINKSDTRSLLHLPQNLYGETQEH